MTKVRAALAVLAVALGLTIVPGVSSAGDFEEVEVGDTATANQIPGVATGCEEMDHSILRLYFAYFLRNPDEGGFDHWRAQYQGGAWPLTRISEFFAGSPEFIERYGALTDEQFVRQIYLNVLFREPDAGGLAHWTGELARGVRRGTVMLAFSESEEYISGVPLDPNDPNSEWWIAPTIKPIAGYGRWYPNGIVWACEGGNRNWPITRDFAWADILMWNNSGSSQNVTATAYDGSDTAVFQVNNTVANGFILFTFGNERNNSAVGWRRIEFQTAAGVINTIVLYDNPPPPNRPGWVNN